MGCSSCIDPHRERLATENRLTHEAKVKSAQTGEPYCICADPVNGDYITSYQNALKEHAIIKETFLP